MKKAIASRNRYLLDKIMVKYICLSCGIADEFPLGVVRDFDHMGGKASSPPIFCCQQCGGDLYPENYKGVNGVEYKISNLCASPTED
ncbi:hypothetical protein [Cohnella herbarum]|uniref:Uncharacterized protein n=1 Tax=Cohnella herbarum TaxID=2728023 RepID=A0A7Z2VET8_9BACL|nr:hypothetical protein [Cohnella herbarum]QJD81721.1 hypothetical protein HH215_23995 [Cohnella herbarum]